MACLHRLNRLLLKLPWKRRKGRGGKQRCPRRRRRLLLACCVLCLLGAALFWLAAMFYVTEMTPAGSGNSLRDQASPSRSLADFRRRGQLLKSFAENATIKANTLKSEDCYMFYDTYQQKINPPHPNEFTEDELERRFGYDRNFSVQQARQDSFRAGCAKHPELFEKEYVENDSIVFLADKNMSFCLIEKSGSTFFKQVFFAQYYPFKPTLHSPFQTDFERAHGFALRNLMASLSAIRHLPVKNVIAVRDPYSRLFSGYLNKFFVSNVLYWKTVTDHLNAFRGPEKLKTHPLGHDITFEEFVRFVIKSARKIDVHFMPLTRHQCMSCDVTFSHIIKLETMQDDLSRLLDDMGEVNSKARIYFTDMRQETELYNIVSTLCQHYESLSGVSTFMNLKDGFRRIWRFLQISGYIDIDDVMPDTLHFMPFEEVFQTVFQSFRRRSPKAGRQKDSARRQAFLSLSMKDLRKLKVLYQADFDVFGYDPEPPEIFADRERKRSQAAKEFQYFDILD